MSFFWGTPLCFVLVRLKTTNNWYSQQHDTHTPIRTSYLFFVCLGFPEKPVKQMAHTHSLFQNGIPRRNLGTRVSPDVFFRLRFRKRRRGGQRGGIAGGTPALVEPDAGARPRGLIFSGPGKLKTTSRVIGSFFRFLDPSWKKGTLLFWGFLVLRFLGSFRF